MNRFVLDCSVAMAWCFEDESDEYTDAALSALADGIAIVPNHWPLEIVNVLLCAERRERMKEADTEHFVELLCSLPIVVDPETPVRAKSKILSLGRKYTLSSYDAAYLELAMRDGLPLATKDHALRCACKASGVLPFSGRSGRTGLP